MIPKHQLKRVARSTKIMAYLKPPTLMQLPKAISRWTTSRYFVGVLSIGLPRGALGIVVYDPKETGNSPWLINCPSVVAEMRCL